MSRGRSSQDPWFFLHWFWDDTFPDAIQALVSDKIGERPDDLDSWTFERDGDDYTYRDAAGEPRFKLPTQLVDTACDEFQRSESYRDGVKQRIGGGYRRAIDEVLTSPFWKKAEQLELHHMYYSLGPRVVTDPDARREVEDLERDYAEMGRSLLDVGERTAEAIALAELAEQVRDARVRDARKKRYGHHVAALCADGSPMSPETKARIAADWERVLTESDEWDLWFERRLDVVAERIGARPFTKTDKGYKQSRPLFNPLSEFLMEYLLAGQHATTGKPLSDSHAATVAARTLHLFAPKWYEDPRGHRFLTRYLRHVGAKKK